jgi:cysteine synthase B
MDTVGNTPLLELRKYRSDRNVRIFLKGEFMNPGGSVKDRAAKAMLTEGIQRGLLTNEKTIIDTTSGNTGISYAMFGAYMGYRVKLCIPSNVTEERKKIMNAFGADLVETSPIEGIEGAYSVCRKIVAEAPEKYFYPDQYSNECNWKAHYFGTAEEIWQQTNGEITHFVSGTGTSGTFTGCTKKLKEYDSKIESYIMMPDSPFHGIEGVRHESVLQHIGFFDKNISDGTVEISTETAYRTTKWLARNEGLFVGISAGANVAAAMKIAEKAPRDSLIVTILCDGGSRYLSDDIWGD